VKTITGQLSPKSINNNGKNLYFAQNMIYNHSVTVYDSAFNLVSTINDKIKPSEYGFTKIKGSLTGGPVESAATKDGKYVWVSNYNMTGTGFANPGCDTCKGKGYDQSFIYKINTQTFKIENIVEVGSVPKYLAISPDQKKLLVSNWTSGNISIISLDSEKEVKRVYVGTAPRGIAFDSTSTMAYIAVMGGNKIVSLNLQTFTPSTLVSRVKNPRHLCIDKNYLYASLNGEGAICRINLIDTTIKKLTIGKEPRSMVISGVKNKLFVDCYEERKIAIIDLNTFKVETELNTGKYPIGICLSNDGSKILVSCYVGFIQVFAETETADKKANSVIASAPQKETVKPSQPVASEEKKTTPEITAEAPDHEFTSKFTDNKNAGNYYIVLGSFSVKENALNFKNKLLQKGISIELIDNKGGLTYCAFRASNKEASDELMAKLETITGIKGWVYQI